MRSHLHSPDNEYVNQAGWLAGWPAKQLHDAVSAISSRDLPIARARALIDVVAWRAAQRHHDDAHGVIIIARARSITVNETRRASERMSK